MMAFRTRDRTPRRTLQAAPVKGSQSDGRPHDGHDIPAIPTINRDIPYGVKEGGHPNSFTRLRNLVPEIGYFMTQTA